MTKFRNGEKAVWRGFFNVGWMRQPGVVYDQAVFAAGHVLEFHLDTPVNGRSVIWDRVENFVAPIPPEPCVIGTIREFQIDGEYFHFALAQPGYSEPGKPWFLLEHAYKRGFPRSYLRRWYSWAELNEGVK